MKVDEKQRNKICVIYNFFDDGGQYRKNFLHFLLFAILDNVDYFICISGDSAIDIPKRDNIKILFFENKNRDFGTISGLLDSVKDLNYDYFFVLNSTVRGPFFPFYTDLLWYQPFTRLLQSDVGLCGLSVNLLSSDSEHYKRYKSIYPDSHREKLAHVQSMMYAIQPGVLRRLVNAGLFDDRCELKKEDIICKYEIHMSQLILDFGFNLAAILPAFVGVDFRISKPTNVPIISYQGDIWFPGMYRGRGVHPYDSIFVKTNRSMYSEDFLDELSSMSLLHHHCDINAAKNSIDVAAYYDLLRKRRQ